MNKKVLKRLLSFMKGYMPALLGSLFFAAISVASTICIPYFQGSAVDCIKGQGQVDFDKLYIVCRSMGAVILVTSVSTMIMNRINNFVTYRIVKSLREEATAKISKLSFETHDKYKSGDILSRVTTDAEAVGDGLLLGFTQLFSGVLTIICTIVFMLKIHLFVAASVVVLTPLSFYVAKFVAGRTFNLFTEQSKIRGTQTGFTNEMIENARVVKAFGYEDEAIKDFINLNNRLCQVSKNAAFFSSLVNPTSRFVNNIVYAVVTLFGAFLCASGGIVIGGFEIAGMTIGNLTSFLGYTSQYAKPFNEISGVVAELQNAFASAARLFELIDEVEELEVQNPMDIGTPEGAISFENISFSYDKSKKLIENLSLDVKPGQKIAIVGPTGSGKTTIIQLLMKFYSPDGGRLVLDGTDFERISSSEIRKNFGMVLQETWIKKGTIRDNLKFADDNITDEEMIEAAKKSGAHSFIRRLPKGYDTVLSSGGEGISVGQRQLLCITRVMLHIPPMLILDEATSSIDTRTELKIQAAFGTMMSGRTTFIVAHRLSTIRSADLILVVNAGKVVEMGTHEDLLLKDGFYAGLHRAQYE